MSGSLSAYLETQLLAHAYGGPAYAPPAAQYVGLYTTAPTYEATGTEIAGGNYARLPVLWSAVAGVPPAAHNIAAIQWPAADTAWGAIVAVAIMDDPIGGNMLSSALLVDKTDGVTPAPQTIRQGDIFYIAAGGLVVGFIAPASGLMRSRMTARIAA